MYVYVRNFRSVYYGQMINGHLSSLLTLPPTLNPFQYFEVVAKPDVILRHKRCVERGWIFPPSNVYFRLPMTDCTASILVN